VCGYDDLRRAVLAGTKKLHETYPQAQARTEDRESVDGKMATLRAEAPDLADQVAEETITFDEAMEKLAERRAAIVIAVIEGVEPTFTTYTGDDPDGYALAVNIARRHLTTGAWALIAAKAARLDGNISKIAKCTNLYRERISEALLILDWCDVATAAGRKNYERDNAPLRAGGSAPSAPTASRAHRRGTRIATRSRWTPPTTRPGKP
jgi:hypothetical protein